MIIIKKYTYVLSTFDYVRCNSQVYIAYIDAYVM